MLVHATAITAELLEYLAQSDVGIGRLNARLEVALAADLASAGIPLDSIETQGRVELEGSYSTRSSVWDVAIFEDDLPVALIEIKTLLSSLSKNLMNRIDEIVALATNVTRAFDGPDRAPYKPCVAILLAFQAKDSPRHLELAREAFGRMMADRLINALCLLAVDRDLGTVVEPFEAYSFNAFVTAIREHSAASAIARTAGAVSAGGLGRAFAHGGDVAAVVAGITSTPEGLSAAESAVIRARRRVVADLQCLALLPEANETLMHAAIGSQFWIFGGQYIGMVDRRTIVPLDQYDIPLVCADGSLEIVELKGPEASLVRRHRNHLIVSNEVHEAVNQCLNYLRALDEMGAALRTQYRNELDLDVDFRRARGTVIIGHPARVPATAATTEQVEQTIRSYNAHLSRLTVRTYADILESAERTLRFASDESASSPR
ncbi:Shedu anti-phage system protein SduA domain-containing protein [Dactylosporangium sp. CA-152071]|uniref:Shedu anti-phage system protein SduA domain-containing protein n=1 Tax=Dactylosporangium sp. CA-152071 TaxID=3239933 RepID=UPI003D8B52AB